MWEEYYSVTSVQEALELLNKYRDSARIIAGGTDILIEMERGVRRGITSLIDISRVEGLDGITLEDGVITLGALVTHNHVVDSDIMLERALPLAQACWEVGAPQIRNRATVAGNLITASPANDTITPLMALDASVHLASVDGERVVSLHDFYTGYRHQVMHPHEMLTHITFNALKDNQRGLFYKLGLRAAQAISVMNTAVLLTFDGETVTDARITLGSVAATIIRAPSAEAALIGQKLTSEVMSKTAQAAADTPTPLDDVRGTAEYRTEMVRVLVLRALRTLAEGQPAPSWARPAAMLWGIAKGRGMGESSVHNDTQPIHTTINGQPIVLHKGQDKTLLDLLREDAQLTGTKEGCAEGECGACTVFLDGAAVMACMVPAPRAHGAEVVTVEGLQDGEALHPIQQSFIDAGAVQCGYCTPGFLMSGAKLLEEHPNPTREQVLQSISGNLCRCTGYYKIVQAFMSAKDRTIIKE